MVVAVICDDPPTLTALDLLHLPFPSGLVEQTEFVRFSLRPCFFMERTLRADDQAQILTSDVNFHYMYLADVFAYTLGHIQTAQFLVNRITS